MPAKGYTTPEPGGARCQGRRVPSPAPRTSGPSASPGSNGRRHTVAHRWRAPRRCCRAGGRTVSPPRAVARRPPQFGSAFTWTILAARLPFRAVLDSTRGKAELHRSSLSGPFANPRCSCGGVSRSSGCAFPYRPSSARSSRASRSARPASRPGAPASTRCRRRPRRVRGRRHMTMRPSDSRDAQGFLRFATRERPRRAALPRRPPHRLGARVGVRPRHARRAARQGARRGTSARMDDTGTESMRVPRDT